MQGEDSHQGICGAEPGLVEGIEDMQVQERRGLSVPLVAWTDQEGGPAPSSLTSLSHWPFPALAAHSKFMGESLCETISILLLFSVPGWREGAAIFSLPPAWDMLVWAVVGCGGACKAAWPWGERAMKPVLGIKMWNLSTVLGSV